MSEEQVSTTHKEDTSKKIIDYDKNTQIHYSAALGSEDDFSNKENGTGKIDVENYLGWTPLMMACRNGHIKVVKILLELGADSSRKNKFGMSVFLISISSGNLEIVTLLLQHLLCGGISKKSIQSIFSPLSISILFGHQHILQYLTTQNFDMDKATPHTGITPLMFAAAMDDCPAFTLLLSKGANTKIKNHIGLTAHQIQKLRYQTKDSKAVAKPLTPAEMIAQSPHMHPYQHQMPCFVVSPQPTFYQLTPSQMLHQMRKSSNLLTPSPQIYYGGGPPISPFNFQPQFFFPPDFSPNHIFAAAPPVQVPNYFNNSNDFLNMRLNQSMFLSPDSLQMINYTSPCM